MMENRLLNKYINALYDSAKKGNRTGETTAVLMEFDSAVRGIPKFRTILLSKTVSVERKLSLFEPLKDHVHITVLNLFYMIVKRSRCELFPDLYGRWIEKLERDFLVRNVTVITPHKADDLMKKKIDQYLKSVDPEGIHVKTYAVDYRIIGGFKVIVGNTVYDNSLERRLSWIKKKLL